VVETNYGQIWVSRRNFVQDIGHRYLVYIDGTPAGELPPYRTGRYQVAAGFHRVWARRTHSSNVAMGDVVINVQPGEVRRVRTTTRLKRLPFWKLLRALVPDPGSQGIFNVEFSPGILLRATPPSDLDLNPPPNIGMNTSSDI
jgi:hypothetical protein